MTLNVSDLQSGYSMLPVLHGASCHVETGELVSLFGPNGAGKTTLARAIFGEIPVHAGTLTYGDSDLSRLSVEKRTDLKMAYVPQENSTFPDLTVEENIRVGLTAQKRRDVSERLQYAYDMFLVLGERRYQGANTLSGGERKSPRKNPRKSPRKNPSKNPSKKHKKRSVSPSRARRKVTKRAPRTKKKTIRIKKGRKCSCGSKTYTGKENTPRGLGKCEECVPLNIVLRGTDDKLYENRKGGWFKLT